MKSDSWASYQSAPPFPPAMDGPSPDLEPAMRTVYKYPFPTTDDFTLSMPAGAEILAVQVQKGQPCLWAMVDPGRPQEARHFRVHGTGHPIDADGPGQIRYIDSYQLLGGDLVFHVFERSGASHK